LHRPTPRADRRRALAAASTEEPPGYDLRQVTLSILDALRDVAGRRAFLRLPRLVYAGDPAYCASRLGDVVASLERRDFAERQRAMVAVEAGRPMARLVARLSPALRDAAGRPYGMIGFFEALAGDSGGDAAGRLFAEAFAWLRAAGAGEIIGPMDGDTWHRYRLSVGPWEEAPFLLEPYNPPHYRELWEAQGFTVLEGYGSQRVDDLAAVAAHLEPRRQQALAAGYRLRRFEMSRFREELGLIYRLSCAIFAGNFLYTEIPEAEFVALYAGARGLLDPDLIWLAEAAGGECVGFLFAYPDRFREVAALRGGRGPGALLRYGAAHLARRGRLPAVNFKTLGVLAAHRRAGVAAALMAQGYLAAAARGYRAAHHCLIRDGNPSGNLDGGHGRVLRRYHLYRLATPAAGGRAATEERR
jgi:hypothetical protein